MRHTSESQATIATLPCFQQELELPFIALRMVRPVFLLVLCCRPTAGDIPNPLRTSLADFFFVGKELSSAVFTHRRTVQ
jgi:hypothetical protein